MTAGVLGEVKNITVETDEEKPVSVAIITDQGVEIAEGYRVRVEPIDEN